MLNLVEMKFRLNLRCMMDKVEAPWGRGPFRGNTRSRGVNVRNRNNGGSSGCPHF